MSKIGTFIIIILLIVFVSLIATLENPQNKNQTPYEKIYYNCVEIQYLNGRDVEMCNKIQDINPSIDNK